MAWKKNFKEKDDYCEAISQTLSRAHAESKSF